MPRIADGPVIACYGCCNRLHDLNNRNLLFTVLEARPGSRCQQDWFLLRTVGEGSVPGLSPWLMVKYLLSPYMTILWCFYLFLFKSISGTSFSFYKDTDLIRLQPHPNELV